MPRFPHYHADKTSFRHREVISTTIDLGVKVEKKYLTAFKDIKGFEQVYNNKHYRVSVVVYPKGEKILSFDKILREVKGVYGNDLLSVYVLVSNGVFGCWFALYFRKDFELRKGLIWQG